MEKEELAKEAGGIGDGVEARQKKGEDAAAGDDEEARQIGQGEGKKEGAGRVGPHLLLPHEKRPLARDVWRGVA